MTDNPNLHTGMARVGREIALQLAKYGHKVFYLGWFSKNTKEQKWPFELIPTTGGSFFGEDIFEEVILSRRPDTVLTIGDPWMYSFVAKPAYKNVRRLFQWVGYTAVDGEKVGGGLPNFWNQVIPYMDKVVAYTNYGKNALEKTFPQLKDKVDVIYHGVDHHTFTPTDEANRNELRERYKISDKFVFLTVARNQGRKNWPELLKGWKVLQELNLCPNAVFWPHTYFYDGAGHNMDDLLETFGLAQTNSIIFYTQIARGNSPVELAPEKELVNLYRMADCLVSVGGEGFGLPVLEAMLCKVPTLVLNHSATGELGSDDRSLLVEPAHYLTGKYLTERPIPEPRAITAKMITMYEDENLRENLKEKAYKFALNHTWDEVGKKWIAYFDKLENPTRHPLILEEVGI